MCMSIVRHHNSGDTITKVHCIKAPHIFFYMYRGLETQPPAPPLPRPMGWGGGDS
jgi:hypothetical protein